MLPPLVVTEADIAEAIDRIDRAATRIEQTQKLRKLQGAAE